MGCDKNISQGQVYAPLREKKMVKQIADPQKARFGWPFGSLAATED